ncbi:Threonine aldolase [Mortierella polycephala]|uniref:Threonine aldolase n=1 Tax=Mortierella polycephala TaxID=41804 RepID=A0A9P6U0B3_9FUNG|nr:Threonine aldolase [Mortierella polycephala]
MSESKVINPLPYSDFRSDTATAPTPDMFQAMMQTSLGDDVYNECDSVQKLESYVATLCGHEAALYCSSGTMTNQLAHRVHLCNPPQSAMVDIRSHVFNYEAGGISFHSQAAVYPIMPANGKYLTVEDISTRMVHDVDVHYAPTRVVSLENTLNGTIMPIEEIVKIRALTKEHNVKLHLDGARLWHASAATGITMKEYCSHVDTISLCLSKGIGAPIGSILVGSEAVIKKARHFRLLFGGGWRQAGLLAEAALWGIKNNWPTMSETHRRAKWLERVFLQIGCTITNPVDTNMVWVDTTDAGFTVDDLIVELTKVGIKISGSGHAARVVLHYQITDEAVEQFIEVLRKITCSSHTKVEIDRTKIALREQPTSIYAQLPDAPSSPVVGQRVGQQDSSSESTVSVSAKKSTLVDQDDLNFKHDMFGEGQDPLTDSDEPFQPMPRYTRRAFSNVSQERPMSAYEPMAQDAAKLAALKKSRRESQVLLDQNDIQSQTAHGFRSTQSLDLQEMEARSLALQLDDDKLANADKKKPSKLQIRLSKNPASKAIKRASVRIVRWGSLLNKET